MGTSLAFRKCPKHYPTQSPLIVLLKTHKINTGRERKTSIHIHKLHIYEGRTNEQILSQR